MVGKAWSWWLIHGHGPSFKPTSTTFSALLEGPEWPRMKWWCKCCSCRQALFEWTDTNFVTKFNGHAQPHRESTRPLPSCAKTYKSNDHQQHRDAPISASATSRCPHLRRPARDSPHSSHTRPPNPPPLGQSSHTYPPTCYWTGGARVCPP